MANGVAVFGQGVEEQEQDQQVKPVTPKKSPYAKPGSYTTKLAPEEEKQFQSWVKQNKVPWQDSETADYDMRGYYKAMKAGKAKQDQKTQHFPDTWKTPYHKSFSNESQYALPTAPKWQGNQLVDSTGKVLYEEVSKETPVKNLSAQQFAGLIRTKYPRAYDDLDDQQLTSLFIKKYPVYSKVVAKELAAPGYTGGGVGAMGGMRAPLEPAPTEPSPVGAMGAIPSTTTGPKADEAFEQAKKAFTDPLISPEAMKEQHPELSLGPQVASWAMRKAGLGWQADLYDDINDITMQQISGMTSPMNVALLFSGSFMEKIPGLAKASAGLFSATQLKDAYDQFKQGIQLYQQGNPREGRKVLMGGAISTLFSAMSASEAMPHEPSPQEKYPVTLDRKKAAAPETVLTSEEGGHGAETLADYGARRARELQEKIQARIKATGESEAQARAAEVQAREAEARVNAPITGKKPFEEPAQIIQGRQPLSSAEREQQRHDERVTQVKQEIADEKQRRAEIASKALHQGLDVEQKQLESIQERRERELREGEAFRTADQRAIQPLPGEVEHRKLTPMQDALGWLQEWPGGPLQPPPEATAPDLPHLARTEANATETLLRAQQDLSKAETPEARADIEKDIDENKKLLADVKTEKRAAEILTTAKLPKTRETGAAIDGISGNKSTLKTVTADIPVQYRVVEASSLKPSHNPETFAKTRGYPEGVQERTYDTDKEAQLAVIQHGQEYDPAFTINDSPGPEHGPPIITPDGIVLGGNSRVMSTVRHYGEEGEAYRTALAARAQQFGIDPNEVAKMKNPVLVREVTSPPDSIQGLRALGSDLNRAFTRKLSEYEQAVSAGKRISQETLDFVGSQLTEMGEGASLRDLLRDKPQALLEKMTNDGIIAATERNALVDAKTGALNETGKDFVERALLGAVIDDPVVLANTPRGILAKVERALPSLAQLKARGEPWDITDYLKEALREHIAAASKGVSIQDHLEPATLGLFPKEPVHPITEAIARNLDESNRAGVKKAWGDYAEDSSVDVKDQAGLGFFERPKPWDSFNASFKTNVRPDEWGTLAPAAPEPEKPAVKAAELPPALVTPPSGRDAFRADIIKNFRMAPEKVDAVLEINDAIARAIGVSPDEYIAKAYGGVGQFTAKEKQLARVQFIKDGRAILEAASNRDPHVFALVEEIVHVARRNLPLDLQEIATRIYTEDGKWTRSAEENIAKDFRKYQEEGKAPTPELRSVFEKFKVWLGEIYKVLKTRLTPEKRDLFDRMLGGKGLEPTPPEPERARPSERLNLKEMPEDDLRAAQKTLQSQLGRGLTKPARERIEAQKKPFDEELKRRGVTEKPPAEVDRSVIFSKDQFNSAIDALKKKKPPTTLFYTEDEEETIKLASSAMGHLFENGYRDYDSNAARITELIGPWLKPYTRTAYDRMLTEGKSTAQKKLGGIIPENERRKYSDQLGLFETQERKNRRIELPPGVEVVPRETLAPETSSTERPQYIRKEPYARTGTEGRAPLGRTPGGAEQPLGREPLRTTGGRVPPTGAGTRGGGVQETPGRGLRVVAPPTIDVAFVPTENPVIEPGEWKKALETANLPSNLPPPTVSLSPDIEEKLILNGQPEVTSAALSALDKYHAVVMATSTGSGKMYMGSAMLAEKKPKFGLVLSPSDPVSNKWIEVAKGFGVEIKKLPKGAMPTEPGIYVGTYQTATKRTGVDKFKWDMMIADESQNARGWHGGTAAGNMVKTLGANAENVVYMSATPYQNVLEMGYMDKLGIWGKQGFENWAAKEFHTYKNPNTGKWVVPFNPRKLAALREELVRRGMQINLDRDMTGVQVHFSKVPLSEAEKAVQKDIVKAFKLAENYFAGQPGGDKMIMATKGNAVTFMKTYLERLKLPDIIEQAKKTADAGWKNTFFSQTKAEIDEIYKFLRPADEYYRGEISKLLPKLPGLVETLKEAFGDDIADYTGATNAKREEGLRAFNAGEKKHIVATYGAGGVGVGMHDEAGNAPRAVFYTGMPWSGVVFDQALGRHIRGGARSDILVHIPVTDSAAEIGLMAKKIMPRLESLRAAISGVDKNDPMLKGMADIEALLDYGTFGNKNKTTIEELTDTAPEARAIKNIKELSAPDAEKAKDKPMRGERKKPMKPPETLYYKEPPENLGEPPSDASESAKAVRRPFVPKEAEKDVNDPRMLDWLNDINEQYLRMTQGGLPPAEPPKKPPAPPDEVIGTKQIPPPGRAEVEYDIPDPQVMRSLHEHFKNNFQKLGLSDEDITKLAKLEGWKNLKIAQLHTAPTVLANFQATQELARMLPTAEGRYRRDVANTKYDKNEMLHDFRNDPPARKRIFEALQRAHDPEKELRGASSEWTADKKPFTPAELHAAQRIRDEILNPIIEEVRKVRPDIGLRWKYAPLVRQINELLPTLYPELNGNIPADLVEDFSLELRQATTKQPFSVHELKRDSTPPKALDIDEVLDGYIPSMLRLKHYTDEARKAGIIINNIPDSVLKEYAEKYTRTFFGVPSEYKRMDQLNRTFSRTLSNMVYSAALDLNPHFFMIHSLKVPWNVWSDLGTEYTAKGYAGMTTADGRELVARSGILMDTLYTIRKPKTTFGSHFSKFLHYGLQLSDQIDRGVAYIGGLEQAKDLGYFGPPEKVGKITPERLDQLAAEGIDVEKGIMHAYSVVSRTNFMYTNGHVQPLIREHPVMGKFRSFQTRQLEFMHNVGRMAMEAREARKKGGVNAEEFAARKAANGEYGYVNAEAKLRRLVFMTAVLAFGATGSIHIWGHLLAPDVLFAEQTEELLRKTADGTATEKMWSAWFKLGLETFVPGGGFTVRKLTAPGAPLGPPEKKHRPAGLSTQPSRRKHVAHF